MTTQSHIRIMKLTLDIEGHEVTTTDFDAFVRANEIGDDDAEEIAITLLEQGEYHSGGGAGPWYTLAVRQ